MVDAALERACEIVARKDAEPLRRAMFRRLASQSRAVRVALRAWEGLGSGRRASAFVGALAAKSFLEVRAPAADGDLLAIWKYANEERQISALGRLDPGLRMSVVTLERAATVDPSGWRELAGIAPDDARGARSILERYVRGGDFLVAARVASTIGYSLRLRPLLEASQARAVLVSSDANPYAVALVQAARHLGRKTCFVTHGHVAEGPPPLDFDLSLLDGPVVREVYARSGPIRGRVVYKGSEGAVRPMDTSGLRAGVKTLGVFLSILVDWPRVGEIIARLRADLRPERVILRLHPNLAMRDPDWARHVDLHGVDVSSGSTVLTEDALACDLVVAGNSSAHLTLLKFGVPTVYLAGLDDMEADYYRFVQEGIVFDGGAGPLEVGRIAPFYEDAAWVGRFARFDAGYPDAQASCDRALVAEVRRLCGPKGAGTR